MLLHDSAGAEELYSRAVDRSRELANIADLMHALHLRARCELDLGKVAVAEADAAEALQFGRQLGQPGVVVHSLALLARVAALRGDIAESRRRTEEALEHAIPHRLHLAVCAAALANGEIDVSLGHPAAALERLEPLIADPVAHPAYLIELAALTVEAAALARTPGRGLPALALYEAWAECFDAPAPRATLARCRGLLADRAAEELRASGEVARRQLPSGISDLTPRERQVARLAAAGHSNGEVAARLFLSQKTVEYHLHKVFTKLGVASRADLSAVRDQIGPAAGVGEGLPGI